MPFFMRGREMSTKPIIRYFTFKEIIILALNIMSFSITLCVFIQIYMNEIIQIAVEDCELLKGRHQFSFRTIIPDTCPSSFECEYGTVRYGSRVTLRTIDNKLSKFDYFPFSAVARYIYHVLLENI